MTGLWGTDPRRSLRDQRWERRNSTVLPHAVAAAADAAAIHGGQPKLELSIVLVDEEFLCDLHLRYLDDPSPTDVITFDLGEGPGPGGEVYVSVDRAREVSSARGTSLRRELALYVVHGVLHLCGFDDHAVERPHLSLGALFG